MLLGLVGSDGGVVSIAIGNGSGRGEGCRGCELRVRMKEVGLHLPVPHRAQFCLGAWVLPSLCVLYIPTAISPALWVRDVNELGIS